MLKRLLLPMLCLAAVVVLAAACPALGQEAAGAPTLDLKTELEQLKGQLNEQQAHNQVVADTLWVLFAAFLVFFMNTGFGCVEAGFCRAKNATNILGKNFVVFAISSLAFWAVGWTIMFSDGNAFLGYQGFFLSGADNSPATTPLADLIKADIGDQYDIDLDDEEIAEDEKYASLIEKIDEISGEAQSTITSATVKEGDEEKEATFKVVLEVPGQSEPFEKEYAASEFYWGAYGSISWTGIPLLAKFFFQLVFAGTAATIVSGCVAERIHYKSFMFFTVFIAAFSYPITGHWIWGGGFLADLGFWDFAGSTVVHSVGGWAGLAGIILLGPRLGKYRPNGSIQPIPGHSMALAFLGGMILWLGWFGFNPGSTMEADPGLIAHIVITTNLACAAGMLAATALAWGVLGKPDFSMTVNGALAGLVAITAPCAWVTQFGAVIIGLVGGLLVVGSVLFFDRIRVDDPVGALSVHLTNGIWGTVAIGLFAAPAALGYEGGVDGPAAGLFAGGNVAQLISQLIGVAAVGVFTFTGAFVVWVVIKVVMGIRVHAEEEITGLDVTEMGMEAYNGFQVTDPTEYIPAMVEPRAAAIPPNGDRRFVVTITGPSPTELMNVWSQLCQPGQEPPPEFKEVYPHMTTVRGNRFHFRSGEPEKVRSALEKLFKSSLADTDLQAHVESAKSNNYAAQELAGAGR